MTRRAAGADPGADHPHHHLGVALAPGREIPFDVRQERQQPEGQVQDRLVPIEIDEERRLERAPGEVTSRRRLRVRRPPASNTSANRLAVASTPASCVAFSSSVRVGLLWIEARSAASMASTARRYSRQKSKSPKWRKGVRSSQPSIRSKREGSFSEASTRAASSSREARRVGSVVELKAVAAPHSQLVLEQAKLNALKARGRDQVVPEIEEVERGHGLQNVDLLNQDALDLDDAPATAGPPVRAPPPGPESLETSRAPRRAPTGSA